MTRSARRHGVEVSVVINAFQQAATVDLMLSALRAQDFAGDWEVIVVDDGSADATSDVVARHQASLTSLIYCRQAHAGNRWSAARNLGMRISAGNVLIFLDGDMIPDRDLVRRHAEAQAGETCVLAGNRLWRNPATDLNSAASPHDQLAALAASASSADPESRRHESREAQFRRQLIESDYPWRACFGCHVSFIATTGEFFDENMQGWGPADIELACRLHYRHNLPVRYEPTIRAWQVESVAAVGNPFRTGDRQAATELVRQVCYMITKYPELPLRQLFTIGWDRIVLGPDGTWATVPKGEGGDPAQTLERALAWYALRQS